MKENKQYVNTKDVTIYPFSCKEAKPLILNNHYSHVWTMCSFAYGIYNNGLLIGCAVYGIPVGRLAAASICKEYKPKVLELTRLWIADDYGCNIESYSLSQTFTYLKKKSIEVLLAYSDPDVGHLGKIYQATNWLYQGNAIQKVDSYWFTIFGKRLHERTVVSKYGSANMESLRKIDKNVTRKYMSKKHRYIYILTDKKTKRKILKDLKHPIIEYPKEIANESN